MGLGELHGLYSSWGHKESDTTEWLSVSLEGSQGLRWVPSASGQTLILRISVTLFLPASRHLWPHLQQPCLLVREHEAQAHGVQLRNRVGLNRTKLALKCHIISTVPTTKTIKSTQWYEETLPLKLFFKNVYFVLECSQLTLLVSGGQQRNSATHAHVSSRPQTPLASGLPLNTEQSSLCEALLFFFFNVNERLWFLIFLISVHLTPYENMDGNIKQKNISWVSKPWKAIHRPRRPGEKIQRLCYQKGAENLF